MTCRNRWLSSPVAHLLVALALVGAALIAAATPTSAVTQQASDHGVIAFVRDGDIRVINPDGTATTRLTDLGDASSPAWSPDGERIAFVRADDPFGQGDLWVMNADGTGQQLLVDDVRTPAWSPDGERIVFSRDGLLFVADVDGGPATQLTEPDHPHASHSDPDWSPDGSRIVFIDWGFSNPQVKSVDADGDDLQLLIDYGFDAVWSPDGSTILFARFLRLCAGALWLMDADGSDARHFHKEPGDCDMRDPAYSPDGEHFVYHAWPYHPDDPRLPDGAEPLDEGLHVVPADGAQRWFLTEGAQPHWGSAPPLEVPEPQPPTCADAALVPPFPDVDPQSVHAGNIACSAGLGLVQGKADGTFDPRGHLTRGQTATILRRALDASGLVLPPAPSPFNDTAGSVHADAISRLAAAGIIQGRTATRFDPQGNVTRAQFASLLDRTSRELLAPYPDVSGPRFDDTADNVHAGAVDRLNAAGIIQGLAGGTSYGPQRSITRAQAASLFVRWLEDQADRLT
jgi:hypothetical protein